MVFNLNTTLAECDGKKEHLRRRSSVLVIIDQACFRTKECRLTACRQVQVNQGHGDVDSSRPPKRNFIQRNSLK